MIEKPEQYYDTRRHQLYYQWRESEHFSHQEPIYDRTREYIESLESENAKLRNEVDNLLDFEHLTSVAVAYAGCDECGEYKQTMLCLFAENAKLRKLVRKVLQFERAGCERCPYASTCDVDCLYESDCPMRKDIEQDMCELGIEVDG